MRRSLHIALAVSLLFLSWLDLAHHFDTHAHQPGHVCEFCLFTVHIGHGAPASVATPAPSRADPSFALHTYPNPALTPPLRSPPTPRGPPALPCA